LAQDALDLRQDLDRDQPAYPAASSRAAARTDCELGLWCKHASSARLRFEPWLHLRRKILPAICQRRCEWSTRIIPILEYLDNMIQEDVGTFIDFARLHRVHIFVHGVAEFPEQAFVVGPCALKYPSKPDGVTNNVRDSSFTATRFARIPGLPDGSRIHRASGLSATSAPKN